jgi:aminoglycoside phosphotransferase (APT) family kinase protein
MPVPAAEIHVDENIVRAVLEEQCSDIAGLEVRYEAEGFDNSLWRLGDDMVVRLPRRHAGVAPIENEIRWLPTFDTRLPLPTSAPLRVGVAKDVFPYPWTVARWFEGEAAGSSTLVSPDHAARTLGEFLKVFHVDAPANAPHNQFRSPKLETRSDTFESRVELLRAEIDEDAVRGIWHSAVRARTLSRTPAWIHGDLHPFNLIVSSGVLSAVVDFGDLCAGDPATDLACAWMLLPESSVDTFLTAYGSDEADLIDRALGWTVLFALMFMELGIDGTKDYEKVGRATIDTAVSYSRRRR